MTSILPPGGDQVVFALNPINNWKQVFNLETPISNQRYFRILTNHVCLLNVSFVKSNYQLTSDGQMQMSKQILVGQDDTWYICGSSSIQIGDSIEYTPDNYSSINEISGVVQFLQTAPNEYIYAF